MTSPDGHAPTCALVLLLALAGAGCGGEGPTGTGSRATAAAGLALEPPQDVPSARDLDAYEPRPEGSLTFTGDIAPIVFANCTPCHRPGEAAPFPFLGYDDVNKRATQIVSVIRSGYMPPWLPEPGYNRFAGERGLTVDQIGTIQQWVADGAVEGDPADLPPPPRFAEGWQLGQPDLVVRLPQPYTLRADPPDVFRNFVMPDLVERARFVRALEFRPGNPKVIHHAEFRTDPSQAARRADEADGEPGFEGMDVETAVMPDGHFLGWVPGQAPSPVPDGMAWRLDAQTDLVIQLHMLPSGKSEPVDPSIGLFFTDEPPRRVPFMIRLGSRTIDIPPGESEYWVEDSYTLPVDVELLSVFPHAHYLGKEMRGFAILPDGTKRWLIRIPEWDFNWQDDFQYLEPIALPRGTTLAMQFSYDNSQDNVRNPNFPPKRVVFGPNTTDEMGDLWLQLLPRAADLAALRRDWAQFETRRAVARWQTMLARDPDDARAHNNLGHHLLSAGRLDEALPHLERAVSLDPSYAHARRNFAAALYRKGEVDRALTLYREALGQQPDDAEAQLMLAQMYYEARRPVEAIPFYRRAVELRPGYAEAHFLLGRALQATGKPDEGIEHLLECVRLEPDWVVPLRAAAWALATRPAASERDAAEAVRLAERAAERTRHRDPTVLEALAAAYAAAGEFARAARTAQAALGVAGGDPRLSARIRGELERYRQGLTAVPAEGVARQP